MSIQRGLPINFVRANRACLVIVLSGLLLVLTLLIAIFTAPISEIAILFMNDEESDTVIMAMYVDDSLVSRQYIGPGGTIGWKHHVSPGTHAFGIDFAYDGGLDGTVDYNSSVHVEFNGIKHGLLSISSEGVKPGVSLPDIRFHEDPPLIQPFRDPSFVVPVSILAALHVILVTAAWSVMRKQPTDRVSRREPRN